MAENRDMPKEMYPDTKAGNALREQARKMVSDQVKKKGEFARGEKRQGDGV
jgi:hypothetical protein